MHSLTHVIATNKVSTFPNFALFALCTHFQDHYLMHLSSLKDHTQSLTKMHSMTLCQHHHRLNLITLWGTPVNAFHYFCRPIVIDSDRSTLVQNIVGIVTISWQLMPIIFSFLGTSSILCSILAQK